MKSKNELQNKEYAFDCYCKRVIKNEARKYYNELNRQRNHEILFCDITEQERRQLFTYDSYFTYDSTFNVLEYRIALYDDCLADALNLLSSQLRDIILLYYFVGLTDKEIGQRLSVLRATVQYRRKSALKLLKNLYHNTE